MLSGNPNRTNIDVSLIDSKDSCPDCLCCVVERLRRKEVGVYKGLIEQVNAATEAWQHR